MNISYNRRLFEICAAVITGLGKLVFFDVFDQKLIYIIIAITFWVGYVFYRKSQDKLILEYWGFTTKNLWSSFKKLLPYALFCVLAFLVYGLYFDTLIFNWHLILILLLYPTWGAIQQFLVVGLVAGNLNDQDKFKLPKFLIILLTASLFAIVHYPTLLLIVATFLLAIVYSFVYLNERNLWVLGIYHGWLGAFFYFFVLGQDPLLEVFGNM